jgi:succinate dehydrogenase / fumarate reductase cytochrome b subunit
MPPRARPLSPHLQIYKFTITMAMSIVHRITGIGLYGGTLLLVIWLGAAALGEGPLGVVNGFFGHWFGQFVLFGYTWTLFHHMLGGIRHFIWDSGNALLPGQREALAWANLIGSIALTILAWVLIVTMGVGR